MPCLENQISFMKSTFFEDISYLGDFFQSPANLQSRNFDASKHEESLTKIYQKGIQLALCNFEGNDDILIWEFLNKCQPKFLWIVIEQNLCVLLEGEPGETI